jgi:enoyl-[acyl-carrier protein] reductase III
VLVANAAATAFRPLLETKPHHVERTFAITVSGFLRCVQEAVPLMDGRGGAIVAVSGFDTLKTLAGHGTLGAAKASMEMLVRYLAAELAERRIREEWIPSIPASRIASPDEIAAAIFFLCSADASYVYGQTLVVDGGLTLA